MIKEEEGDKERPDGTQRHMVTVEIPATSSCSSPTFNRDSGTGHDKDTIKQPTLDVGNNHSHDRNEYSDNDDVEDDEGDENYIASEDESEAGDRAPKRQRRISICPENLEDRSKRRAKSTTSSQSTEGCTSSPASQKDRHGLAELLTDVRSSSLPMNDILMLASNIASVVVV